MNDSLAHAWDVHVDTYDQLASPFTGYLAHGLFQSIAGRLPNAPSILDVACGSGAVSRAALLHCAPRRAGLIVATDFSPAMVQRAERNLSPLDPGGMLRCEVRDGQALGVESAMFDAVISSFGIFLFPDRRAGWAEALRALRPGGLLATAVWRGPEHNALARLQMEPVLESLPERVRTSLTPPDWLTISTREGLSAEVASQGFTEIEVSTADAVFHAPTPRAMWLTMLENPVSGALLSKCDRGELADVERHVLRRWEALSGGPDRVLRLDASCHYLVARKPS